MAGTGGADEEASSIRDKSTFDDSDYIELASLVCL